MSDSEDFYVGYGTAPDVDRRFLLRSIPVGLACLTGAGTYMGLQAQSSGGGRWETGMPVTLNGRISFSPYPTLWSDGKAHIIAGIGKAGADPYIKPFEGKNVTVTGIRIMREDCVILGVAEGDIALSKINSAQVPNITAGEEIEIIGEVLDAQCFLGIMNPGYGRTHRGCATLCVRGGQPVFFSVGVEASENIARPNTCSGQGFLLTASTGEKINSEILNVVGLPVVLRGRVERMGSLTRLRPAVSGIRRVS